MLESVTSKALESALDGLSMRQKAIANNIANINTPGYTAERVSFEDALAASVDAGNGSAAPSMSRSMEPTREDGNNVNLDTETLSNTTTVLQYQFATQAENNVLTSVRAVLKNS
ncbi:Flagellar basal body rod protein FlgB [Frondihabitans sp. 762G35]|uniref:flagellar basal body rod protein FlgB n=1 Tax=Frondihabitans sp. 762G35 TaxID=1446794 RepID=UPI000D2035E7|nr:flagellar basal body protein [Frondihabitans sp. 762G35]ARC55696.1 Flagellar basal body rod protein FlgB [Frondihabitans sp. 762G35]